MLATQADVEAALGRSLTANEAARVGALIDQASDLVTGHLHPCPIPTPTPGPITRVVAEMAANVLSRPTVLLPETQTMATGPHSVSFAPGATSPGPYLTAAFKTRLAPYRCGNGMVSVQLGSERY